MRLAVNGVTYHLEVQGRGPAVLFLHGFTGSVATWAPHLGALEAFTTLRLDFLGHGASDAPSDMRRYGMAGCIDDILSLLERLGIRRFAVAGYSMGGRVAMRIALRSPERVWALVLESASPGIAEAAERRARARRDSALAQRIRKEGVTAFVNHWQSIPLFASQSRLPRKDPAGPESPAPAEHPGGSGQQPWRAWAPAARRPCCTLCATCACRSCCWRGNSTANTASWPTTWQPCCPCRRLHVVPRCRSCGAPGTAPGF